MRGPVQPSTLLEAHQARLLQSTGRPTSPCAGHALGQYPGISSAAGTGIYYCSVTHPDYRNPLWLVVSPPGKGRTSRHLLTNQPPPNIDDAWRLVLAYARRWQVEMAYRYGISVSAMESPRLWRWQNRFKLLLMVTVVYAFLRSLH